MLPNVEEIYPDGLQLLVWGALTLVAYKADGAVAVVYEGKAFGDDIVNDMT
jgi:hypothetical protein